MTGAERESFSELYSAYGHGVYATALAILRNSDTARDVVHDVFLRAWQQAGQYDPSRGTFGVWLRAMARNLSIDRVRSARRVLARERIVDDSGSPLDQPLSQLVSHEQLEAFRRTIVKLSPMHRLLIEMAYDRGLSHRDIARRLHQPLGTVKSRIRQALAMLRSSAGHLDLNGTDGATWQRSASEAFTTIDTDVATPHVPTGEASCLSVLVVDDDHETVRLVSAVLKKFHIRARTCTSAKDGLQLLEECWPDVMISDLNMPGEDGYSLIGKARAMATTRQLRLRAAAFTSWASERERSRALLAGFDVYVNKPVHPVALISAVTALSR